MADSVTPITEARRAPCDAGRRWCPGTSSISTSLRVARPAHDLARDGEVDGYSHQELAERLGISRETVSRALLEFKASGWVAPDMRCIRLVDAAALAMVADETPAG